MELQSFDELERRVTRFLDLYRAAKSERDELAERVGRLEAEIEELKRANASARKELEEARLNVRDSEKEERIKSKVDDLLAKLEGF